jgi:3-oxoacyl-[acyl-carrier-protein] synthase-3
MSSPNPSPSPSPNHSPNRGPSRSPIRLARAAVFLPEGRETAADIAAQSGVPEAVVAQKLGIVEKRRAPADLHPAEMAVRAARLCLQDIDPASIDVVIWTGSEYKDHVVWTAAIHVQRLLGCKNAFAFDLSARCSTGILGMKLAADLLQANPNTRRVLLVGGHRTGDLVDYRDPSTRFLYNLADGGSAMLIERGNDDDGNRLLDAQIVTDGDFSTDVILPAGGTKLPTRARPDPAASFLRVPDPDGMKERLDRVSMKNFLDVIRGAAGGHPIGYLALLHMKRSAHDGIVDALGLAPERAIYLDHYGHFGSPDQVLSLGLAEQRGLLKDGDVVVFASAGLGYMWAAQAFVWNTPTFAPAARAALA